MARSLKSKDTGGMDIRLNQYEIGKIEKTPINSRGIYIDSFYV